jgi:hypothetical protein
MGRPPLLFHPPDQTPEKERKHMSNGTNLPAKLVVEFTTLYKPCSGNVGSQIQQGNTFSVPFDLSHVTQNQGAWNGYVLLTTDAENNFQATAQMQLSAEGLAGKVAFMSTAPGQVTIYGEGETVSLVSVVGTPSGSGFTWGAGIVVGGCVVTNGASADEVAAKLTQS